MNITNNTPTSNNIESSSSSCALNHSKLTTQIFCISFLAVIITLSYANYSLASSLSSKVNSIKEAKSKSDKGDAFQKSSKSITQDKISKTDIIIGNRDAKLLFIEYFAPTCTHCAYYHLRILPELKSKYIDTGKIAYVMREFVGNKQDFDASLLARCKGGVDSYLKLSEHLLLNQDSWAYSKDYREKLFEVGDKHGISKEQYNSCLNNESKAQILFDHTKLIGADKDFIGTPSFYINGELYQGEYTIKAISEFLETVLTKEERG